MMMRIGIALVKLIARNISGEKRIIVVWRFALRELSDEVPQE